MQPTDQEITDSVYRVRRGTLLVAVLGEGGGAVYGPSLTGPALLMHPAVNGRLLPSGDASIILQVLAEHDSLPALLAALESAGLDTAKVRREALPSHLRPHTVTPSGSALN